MNIATAFVTMRPDFSTFERELTRGVDAPAQASAKKLRKSMETESAAAGKKAADNIERPMAGAASRLGGLIAKIGFAKGLKDASVAAANLRDEQDKSGAVFHESANEVLAFAKTTKDAYGISERAALNATGSFGNLFTSFGLGRKQAADMSITLTKLAGDLASFNGTEVRDAVDALRSGLSGETEPLKRFGVALDDAALKQKALSLGIVTTTTGVLPPAARAQAAYALIMERTTNAQGDFARTQDSAANRLKVMKASVEEAAAALGTSMLPAVKVLSVGVTALATGFAHLPGPLQLATVAGLGFIVFGKQLTTVADNAKTLASAIAGIPARFAEARAAGAGLTSSLLGSIGLSGGLAAVTAGLGIGVTALTLWSNAKKKAKQETLDFAAALQADNGVIAEHSLKNIQDALAQNNQIDNLAKAKVSQEQLTAALQAGTDAQIRHAVSLYKMQGGSVGAKAASEELAKSLEGNKNALAQLLVQLARSGQLDIGLIRTLTKFNSKFSEASQLNKDWASVAKDGAAAADDLGSATGSAGDQAVTAADAFSNLADAITGSFSVGRNYESALLGIEKANLDLKQAQDGGTGSTKRQAKAHEDAEQKARRLADAQDQVTESVDRERQAESSLRERTEEVSIAKAKLTQILTGYGRASRQAKDATEELDDALRNQRSSELDVADAKDNVKEKQKAYNEALSTFGPQADETIKSHRELLRAQLSLESAQDGLQDAQKGAKDAQKNLNQVVNGAPKSSNAAKEATAAYNEALQAQKEAEKGVQDAVKDHSRALRDLAEAQKNQTAALSSGGGASKSAAQLAIDLKEKMLQQSGAYDDAAMAAGDKALAERVHAAALKGETIPAEEQARIKAQAQHDEYDRLAKTLAPGSPLRKNLEGHRDDLEKLPGVVSTDIRVVIGNFKDQIVSTFGGILKGWSELLNPLTRILHLPEINVGGSLKDIARRFHLPVGHTGLMMPGSPNQEGFALLRGGERVLSPEETKAYNSTRNYGGIVINTTSPVSIDSLMNAQRVMEFLYGQ